MTFAAEQARLGPDRARHLAAASRWTAETAARLQITPEAVDAAIRRGWTAQEIDRVTRAAELLGDPWRARRR